MPTLCQVCSKLSEPGETVVPASVLCALFYSTFVENLRTDVLAFTVAPVPQRRRWRYGRAMTSGLRGQSGPGQSLSSQSIPLS